MVELTQDEKNALIIITAKIVEIEKEKQACVDAHKAVIKLLEVK